VQLDRLLQRTLYLPFQPPGCFLFYLLSQLSLVYLLLGSLIFAFFLFASNLGG